jgi:hypothetical protein
MMQKLLQYKIEADRKAAKMHVGGSSASGTMIRARPRNTSQ